MHAHQNLATELTSRREPGANPQKPYYPALDGLRAIAVLLVFFVHYAQFSAGWMGVNIFFVLSGFLITGILYDARERPHRFRDFYIRRTLRIFPLYYAVWLAFLLATPLLRVHWQPENLLWPLYLGNWIPLLSMLEPTRTFSLHIVTQPMGAVHPLNVLTGHFWSLCMEEQFYLIWPLVVFSVRSRKALVNICIVTFLLSPLLRVAAMHFLPYGYTSDGAIHNCTFLRFDEFLLGGVAALILRGPFRDRLRYAGNPLLAVACLCLLASWLYGHFALHLVPDIFTRMHWGLSVGITLVDTAALGMILLCLQEGSWFAKVMNLAPLRALGRVSYGFYVFHDIPHTLYKVLNERLHIRGDFFTLILPLCATLALSFISFHFLETPFLRLKTRFEGSGRKTPHVLAS